MQTNIFWTFIRRFFLIGTPLLLLTIELFHPSGFSHDTYEVLIHHKESWFWIHVFQLPLFVLMAINVWIIVKDFSGSLKYFCAFWMWAFVILYGGFDAINGIGIGKLLQIGSTYSLEEQMGLAKAVNTLYKDPLVGGTNSFMSQGGSLAWLIGVWTMAFILYQNNKPCFLTLCFLLSGILIFISHAFPYGPLGFAFFALASILLEFSPNTIPKK